MTERVHKFAQNTRNKTTILPNLSGKAEVIKEGVAMTLSYTRIYWKEERSRLCNILRSAPTRISLPGGSSITTELNLILNCCST
jgi:hypothetical protein